ncbi:MAG: hypothetical protein DWQ01_13325 [Planctomycetota bacterium]|nr:MAG: hypothetical protein DWQ01_13325 [Planctomycetota bacterium]
MLLCALLILAPLLQEDVQEEELAGCRRCDYRGVTDCKDHGKELLAMEQEVLFCSEAVQCETCGGSLLVPCKRCDGGPETKQRESRLAAIRKWQQRDKPVDVHLKRSLLHLEIPQFQLIFDVPELRNGKKKIRGHEFAHLLARDLNQLFELFCQDFGCELKDFRGPERMWFWGRAEDHRSVMTRFLFSTSAGDFKMLGKNPVFSVHTHDSAFQGSVDAIHSLGLHNAAHLLLSNLDVEMWVGDRRGGWFDAGVAHAYEEALLGSSTNYCIDEATMTPNYENGRWELALAKRLKKEEQAFIPAMLPQQTGTLTEEQHAMAWSVVDWIRHQHPEILRPMLNGFQKGRSTRDLFRDTLSLEIYQVEQLWRDWVAAEYPKRAKQKKSRKRR